MFLFLTVVQGLIAAALVGVILMQKSEGGGLGMGGGGSPSSIFSARGAGDFMTRTTTVLAFLFVILSIVLAGLAVNTSSGGDIDDSLERQVAPEAPAADPIPTGEPAPADAAPAGDPSDPLSGLTE